MHHMYAARYTYCGYAAPNYTGQCKPGYIPDLIIPVAWKLPDKINSENQCHFTV